jgi:hypothetical protein
VLHGYVSGLFGWAAAENHLELSGRACGISLVGEYAPDLNGDPVKKTQIQ